MDLEDDALGAWNFIHGAGAGCASIAAWEASHLWLTGGIAVGVFSGLTVVIFHVVHKHREVLKTRATKAQDETKP